MANLGSLLAAQVERSKSKRQSNPVVTLSAEFPGDDSQVNLDWWLREINSLTRGIGIQFEFQDMQMVDRNSVDPIRVATLERRLEEQKAYIADLEAHIEEKVQDGIQAVLGAQNSALSDEEAALRAVEAQGFFVDDHGAKWVDIATEAKRTGRSYIALWRAAKGLVQSANIQTWIVGTTAANGERILVKEGSYVKGKRGKSA